MEIGIIALFVTLLVFLLVSFIKCKRKPIDVNAFAYLIRNPDELKNEEIRNSLDESTLLLIRKIYYSLWMYPNVEIVENLLREFFKNRQSKLALILHIGAILGVVFALIAIFINNTIFIIGGISGSIFLIIALILKYICNSISNKFVSDYITSFIESENTIYNISGSRSGAYQLMNELIIQLKSTKNSFENFCRSLDKNNNRLENNIDRIIKTSRENINEMVQANKEFISKVEESINTLLDSSNRLTQNTKDLTESFGVYEQRLRLTENQWQMLVNNSISITNNIRNFIASIEKAKDVIEKLTGASLDISTASDILSKNQNELGKIIKKLDESLSLYDTATHNQIDLQRKRQKTLGDNAEK